VFGKAASLAEFSASSHSYLSDKCEVHSDNGKGGRGVRARLAIPKFELIAVWSGRLVTREGLDELSPALRRFSLQVEECLYLASLHEHEGADYINHSCAPNAGLSGQISLVALRHIAPGEEITYDYAMSDGSSYDEFPCGCGAAACRGQVTGDDWKRPELWVRYGGHFSPYLQRRIARQRELNANGTGQHASLRHQPPYEAPAPRSVLGHLGAREPQKD
jgi:hypothetical protein